MTRIPVPGDATQLLDRRVRSGADGVELRPGDGVHGIGITRRLRRARVLVAKRVVGLGLA